MDGTVINESDYSFLEEDGTPTWFYSVRLRVSEMSNNGAVINESDYSFLEEDGTPTCIQRIMLQESELPIISINPIINSVERSTCI